MLPRGIRCAPSFYIVSTCNIKKKQLVSTALQLQLGVPGPDTLTEPSLPEQTAAADDGQHEQEQADSQPRNVDVEGHLVSLSPGHL